MIRVAFGRVLKGQVWRHAQPSIALKATGDEDGRSPSHINGAHMRPQLRIFHLQGTTVSLALAETLFAPPLERPCVATSFVVICCSFTRA